MSIRLPYGTVAILLASALLLWSCGRNRESPDETKIKDTLASYADAFSQQDAGKLAKLWAPDGVYINLTTQDMVQGNEAIAQYLLKKHEDSGSLVIQAERAHYEGPDKAIEKGTARFSPKNMPPEASVFKAELVKGPHGRWLLQQVSEFELQAPASHYEHLKALEWLIGSWVDEDENITVDINYEWDGNKNFIVQHFTSKILDENQITGQQIIGWDPSINKIRSWIFDDEGGFGQSVFSNQDDAWYSQMSFILPDGRKGSATHIYSKEGPDSYSFTSESREVDGTLLPNIGPFKIVRKH